jgi:hypothetical protein
MSLDTRKKVLYKSIQWLSLIAFILLLGFPATVYAQKQEEFDQYKIRFDAGWFYSNPTGTIRAQNDTNPVDLVKDLNFNSYSTFAGKVDWKFTRKNHFSMSSSSRSGLLGQPRSAATSSGLAIPSTPVRSSKALSTLLRLPLATSTTSSGADAVISVSPYRLIFSILPRKSRPPRKPLLTAATRLQSPPANRFWLPFLLPARNSVCT